MSRQFIPLLTLPLLSAAAVSAERFVTHAGGVPAAGAAVLGVTRNSATAAGQSLTVDAIGTAVVETGAAIAVGALLEADAQGRCITRTTGTPVARALQATAAAGDFIEVLLLPN